jgi:hypothetical protein
MVHQVENRCKDGTSSIEKIFLLQRFGENQVSYC